MKDYTEYSKDELAEMIFREQNRNDELRDEKEELKSLVKEMLEDFDVDKNGRSNISWMLMNAAKRCVLDEAEYEEWFDELMAMRREAKKNDRKS